MTEADRAGEQAMRDLIEKPYPDHGIIGEEFAAKPAKSGFNWVLDPIDGTRAFICGMPTWTTLIGLTLEGKAVLGVMSQPFIGEVFVGGPFGSWSEQGSVKRRLTVRPAADIGAGGSDHGRTGNLPVGKTDSACSTTCVVKFA